MKQYGFFVDSTKCTGCKTCQVSCKDEKNLDLGRNCVGSMNTEEAVGPNRTISGYKMSSVIICPLPVTTVRHPPV